MVVVTIKNRQTGIKFWLKGTVWSFAEERAQKFDSVEAAQAAFERSMKFQKPRSFEQKFGKPVFENA
jgi:hypothetical protein